ncbi:MAG: LSU ribosomal protein L35p, partial [uncultured Rubrobacteraceae bacterium]
AEDEDPQGRRRALSGRQEGPPETTPGRAQPHPREEEQEAQAAAQHRDRRAWRRREEAQASFGGEV